MNDNINNLSEKIQDNIITCIDSNLENLTGKNLLPRDLEKLKTDLCAMICEEMALFKETSGIR